MINNYPIFYVQYDAYNNIFKTLNHTGEKPKDQQKYFMLLLSDAYISTFKPEHFDGLVAIINQLTEKSKVQGAR